ncbi:MAG: DNA polymerase III subunit gamma/tau [Nitrospinota bacterium]
MAFLASARRWRPQRFEELVGQEHVSRTLQNALARGRVAHAYLFSGMRGVGKTTVARLLAKALNCERGPAEEPCTECSSCREVAEGRHPDVVEVDGASNTSVDDVRDLRERLAYAPFRGARKVYIIDEVHMLSKSAFNALLKSLEEPPPHVVFVFATTEPRRVPETILSRCQQFDFRRIPLPAIEEQLGKVLAEEKREAEPGAVRLIAQMAGGSMRDAQSLLDQVLSFTGEPRLLRSAVEKVVGLPGREACGKLVGALLRKDAAAALRHLAGLFEEGQDLKLFCRSLLDYLRDILVLQACDDARGMVVADEHSLAELRAQAREVSFSELHQLFSLLQAAEWGIRQAENPRLVLEVAFIRMCRLEPLVPVPELLEQLERLARGEPTASAPPPEGWKVSEGGQGGAPSKRGGAGQPPSHRARGTGLRAGSSGAGGNLSGESDRAPGEGGRGGAAEGRRQREHALWPRLVSELDHRKPFLGNSLKGAEVQFPSEGLIEVSLPGGNGSALGMHIENHRALIEEVAAELWGRPVRVRLGEGKGKPAGLPAARAAPPSPASGGPGARGRKDALIQRVVELFEGRVVEGGRGGS